MSYFTWGTTRAWHLNKNTWLMQSNINSTNAFLLLPMKMRTLRSMLQLLSVKRLISFPQWCLSILENHKRVQLTLIECINCQDKFLYCFFRERCSLLWGCKGALITLTKCKVVVANCVVLLLLYCFHNYWNSSAWVRCLWTSLFIRTVGVFDVCMCLDALECDQKKN